MSSKDGSILYERLDDKGEVVDSLLVDVKGLHTEVKKFNKHVSELSVFQGIWDDKAIQGTYGYKARFVKSNVVLDELSKSADLSRELSPKLDRARHRRDRALYLCLLDDSIPLSNIIDRSQRSGLQCMKFAKSKKIELTEKRRKELNSVITEDLITSTKGAIPILVRTKEDAKKKRKLTKEQTEFLRLRDIHTRLITPEVIKRVDRASTWAKELEREGVSDTDLKKILELYWAEGIKDKKELTVGAFDRFYWKRIFEKDVNAVEQYV